MKIVVLFVELNCVSLRLMYVDCCYVFCWFCHAQTQKLCGLQARAQHVSECAERLPDATCSLCDKPLSHLSEARRLAHEARCSERADRAHGGDIQSTVYYCPLVNLSLFYSYSFSFFLSFFFSKKKKELCVLGVLFVCARFSQKSNAFVKRSASVI